MGGCLAEGDAVYPPSPSSLPSILYTLFSFPPSASLFTQELEKARWFNEKLGTGIAFFQALSNLAINGEEWEGGKSF